MFVNFLMGNFLLPMPEVKSFHLAHCKYDISEGDSKHLICSHVKEARCFVFDNRILQHFVLTWFSISVRENIFVICHTSISNSEYLFILMLCR